ncbi:MAG: hypothetical protein K9I94_11395 [Bacteroidales bacterium]|nr:hypothetical protein [Bacteroidales bacterium]
MKNKIVTILLSLTFTVSGLILSAQTSPPPPDEGHGTGQNQDPGGDQGGGGGAPLGSGTFLLMGLGAAYGSKKVYEANRPD